MDNWDFDCPQFVDFAAALDSPSNENFHDISSAVQVTATSDEGHALGPKMATPKVKPNDPLRNFPFINFSTDDEKLATLSKLPARLSKSEGQLDQVIESMKSPNDKKNPKMYKNRRTSFSMDYTKKRRVCPTTPNCLKRTLNSKSKNAKTSEELELQKIAELQNMLQKHLRLNKINLKRLKMNKAPFTLEKLPKKNDPNVPVIKHNLMASSKPAPKPDRNFPRENYFACRATAFSRGIKEQLKILQVEEKSNVVAKKKVPSNVLRDLNILKKDCDNASKKRPLFEKYTAHCGLKFLPHKDKTLPCPFSFDASFASSQNASLHATHLSKIHNSLSVSRNTPCVLDNKENLVK